MESSKNTASATKWVAFGMVIKQGMRLGSNLIMTRILSPETFGLMAIVNLVMQALNMLSDIGLIPSIIRSPRTDDEYLSTAWTVQITKGIFLCFLTSLLAWPVSRYYEEPILLYILPCSGLIALCVGFNSIAVIQDQKKLKFKKLVVLDSLAAFVGLGAMILYGYVYSTIWALVLGGVLSTFLMTIFGYFFLDKYKHVLCWNKTVVHELFHFGKWVFISTALTFFVAQYDKIALGNLADMSSLGLYSIAMVWSQLPTMIFDQLINRIFFPVVAELNQKGELAKCSVIRNSIIKISVVVCIFMVAVGQLIIEVLYSAEYVEAGDLISILAILAWFQIVETINTTILLAVGRPRDKVISQVMGLVFLLVFMSLAYINFGMYGVAGLATMVMMIRAYILDLQLRKDKLYFLLFDIKKMIILIGFGFGLHWLVDYKLFHLPEEIILIMASVMTALLLVYVFYKQSSLRQLMNG